MQLIVLCFIMSRAGYDPRKSSNEDLVCSTDLYRSWF